MIFSQILLKIFDPNAQCFAKYDEFCSHIFDYTCLRRKAYCLSKRFEIMEKLYASKAFLKIKMAGGWMYAPHPTPLDPPLAISYRNHQKSLAYFIHLAPVVLFFLLKGRVKRGRGTAQCPLNTLLPRSLRLGACERIVNLLKKG